jgi:hypothetical protein
MYHGIPRVIGLLDIDAENLVNAVGGNVGGAVWVCQCRKPRSAG